MIELDHLTKKYGRFKAVDDVSFKVDKNEVLALLGPNGAGKTTILKCILGLILFNGRVTVDGLDARRNGISVKRRVAYLPQQFSLYNHMSVEGNIKFFAGMKGVDKKAVDDSLEAYGLEEFAKKRVVELSEGLRQRLMLAATLLGDNPILLFDEPTSNLDVKGVLEFKELVDTLAKKGKTVMLSTHLLSDVNEIASRAVVLNRGKLIAEGSVDEILKKVELNTRILLTLSRELKPESVGPVEELLIKAGAKDVSTEGEFIMVSVETTNKIAVLEAVDEAGLVLRDFRIFEPSLEEAFLKITDEGGG